MRKISRTQQRELELAEARAQQLPHQTDVVVVGGGAAGLVAAITAAEAGASVVLLERELSCGRSILATGGGRCNFSNQDLCPLAYNHSAFVAEVFGADALHEILDFFDAAGMSWCAEEGRLYPRSLQAASVRDVLLERAKRASVQFGCGRTLHAISEHKRTVHADLEGSAAYELNYTRPGAGPMQNDESANAHISALSVVLAYGGSLQLAEKLQLELVETRPVLCPLAASGLNFEALDGRRSNAELTLLREGKELFCERGEVLFRPYGISGIVSFNLSRVALPGDTLILDLVPELSGTDVALLQAKAGSFAGVLDPVIAQALDGRDPKHLELRIKGVAETDRAQMMRGGIATSSLDPQSLAVRAHDALFACGECVDVDGACGGFNLSWAWISGMRAGSAAAKVART